MVSLCGVDGEEDKIIKPPDKQRCFLKDCLDNRNILSGIKYGGGA